MLHLKLCYNAVVKLAGCVGVGQWRVVCHYCDDMKVVRPDAHGQQLNVPGISLLPHMNVSRVTPLILHKRRNPPTISLTTLRYSLIRSDEMKSVQPHWWVQGEVLQPGLCEVHQAALSTSATSAVVLVSTTRFSVSFKRDLTWERDDSICPISSICGAWLLLCLQISSPDVKQGFPVSPRGLA